jgi:methyltransferase
MLRTPVPVLLLSLAFLPMLLEARRSSRNEQALRAMGAHEPDDDVYGWMQVVYPACFLAMIAESWLRAAVPDGMFVAGVVVFMFAKALKYWAIGTLGWRWTFRVLVPPGSTLVLAGPYRFLRHPNYLAVAGELGGMALMAHAAITGPLAVAVFGFLMLLRIRVEERALRI